MIQKRPEKRETGCYLTSVTELLLLSRPVNEHSYTGARNDKAAAAAPTPGQVIPGLIHSEAMSTPEQEVLDARKKRTYLLMAGGAASLVLPLLGVVYIRLSEAKTARPPDSSVMFDRRESGDAKVNVSQTVTIINPAPSAGPSSLPVAGGQTVTTAPGSSSLDFVKGGATPGAGYYQDKQAAAPPATSTQAAPPAPAPAPEPEAAPKTAAKKGGKKAFNMPKLQGTKGFSSFKGASPKPTGGHGMTGVADPQAGGGGDMAEMLKSVPGGASNPEVQKYLKSQGK